jgi:hypothetical protein
MKVMRFSSDKQICIAGNTSENNTQQKIPLTRSDDS